MSTNRLHWVDHAKGISIILVVLTHSLYEELYSEPIFYFSGLFGQVRMPLFFFLAGLFIHKSINSDFSHFFKTKVVHFLYLYIIWSVIRYLTDTVPRSILLNDSDQSLSSILYLFVDPPATLWFIYALLIFFIITRLTRSMPILTFCTAIIVFIFSMQFSEVNFAIKIVRFYPMFLLGYLTSNFIINKAKKIKTHHIIFPIAFLVATAVTKETYFPNTSYGFFLLSCGGILSGIIIASITSRLNLFSWLGYIGQNTLPIYLMHYLPIGILKIVLSKVMPNLPSVAIFITVILGIALPLIAHFIARKFRLDWLFAVPFVNYKNTKQTLNNVS